MNSNWLQEFDIPIGADNAIEPGGPDQGQPTHFSRVATRFLFTIRVPKDFGKKELIWTLTANGKTEHAYASLKSDYQIDKQTISTEIGGDLGSLRDELRSNVPPELKVDGDSRRSVKVGEPLTLAAVASDPDNLPAAGRVRRRAEEEARPVRRVRDSHPHRLCLDLLHRLLRFPLAVDPAYDCRGLSTEARPRPSRSVPTK
jgi:hypothetical protein